MDMTILRKEPNEVLEIKHYDDIKKEKIYELLYDDRMLFVATECLNESRRLFVICDAEADKVDLEDNIYLSMEKEQGIKCVKGNILIVKKSAKCVLGQVYDEFESMTAEDIQWLNKQLNPFYQHHMRTIYKTQTHTCDKQSQSAL